MKIHSTWLGIGILLCAVLACKLGNVSNSNEAGANTSNKNASSTSKIHVDEVHMAKDDNGELGEQTTTFSPEDHAVQCVAKLNDSQAGTQIEFTWWMVDTEGGKNEKIKDLDYTTKALENIVHGRLTVQKDWPKGKYRCDVAINGKSDKSVEYSVE
jgi:hypothetical protein